MEANPNDSMHASLTRPLTRTSSRTLARRCSHSATPPHPLTHSVDIGPLTRPLDPCHAILAASLPHVLSLGWTLDSLRAGARSLSLSETAIGILPRGPVQLCDYFVNSENNAVLEYMNSLKSSGRLDSLSSAQIIRMAIIRRLDAIIPFKRSWPDVRTRYRLSIYSPLTTLPASNRPLPCSPYPTIYPTLPRCSSTSLQAYGIS